MPLADVANEMLSDARSVPVDFDLALDLERRETGSKVTTRGLGAGNGAMSIFSRKLTRLRHERVGFIVVGFVRVDVSM